MSWIDCVGDNDYVIYTEYPFTIKKKSNEYEVSEFIDDKGYICCYLNNKRYRKHRIIALQFIPNDDPVNKSFIDHINHNRSDYHIENLRWVSALENNTNKSSHKGVNYEYFDEIPANPDDIIEVKSYGNHQFENLYFANDFFYRFDGIQYRRLYINYRQDGLAFVQLRNIENKLTSIVYTKFKRLIGLT